MTGGAVFAVGAEVTQTHELVGSRCLGISQRSFHLTVGEHFQTVGIQTGQIVLACGIGIGIIKQIAVLTDFRIHGGIGIHPMDGGTLDLAAISGVTAPGFGIVGCQNFHDITVLVLDATGTLDQVCALQTALGTFGVQTLILGNGSLQEVIGFNPQVTGEGDLTGTCLSR